MTLTLAHLSDTHIGYEAYKTLSKGGENQRSVDFAKAFSLAVDDIIANDPPLVIHAGDVADKTIIPIRLMLFIRMEFSRLAGIRPDGSRRQVVVVAGNHELPRSRKEACFLELIKDLPGVHVSTTSYDKFVFEHLPESDQSLKDVIVHTLPHDVLKTIDYSVVQPEEGKINILSSHGVAGGSELFTRSLGREFSIPAELLMRNWEYVALGHWHKQGPVDFGLNFAKVSPSSTGKTPNRVWYSGSTENSGFGDVLEGGVERGWLKVTISGDDLYVLPQIIPTRKMFRLPEIDGNGLSPSEICRALENNIKAVELNGCIVGQIVTNVDREVWSLVDLNYIKGLATDALHYDVAVKRIKTFNPDSVGFAVENTSLHSLISDVCSEVLSDVGERAAVLEYVKSVLDLEDDSLKSVESIVLEHDDEFPQSGSGLISMKTGTSDVE
ncbi:MAG: exonuclease SbcCD subunit D [Candidatus Paceibacterota bacterium]